MCSPQFSKSLLPNFVLVLSIIFISQHSSIFSSAQKLETNFPAGSTVSGSTELVASLRMMGALPTASRLMQCTGFLLPDPTNNPFWVLQLTGHAPSTTVHHLALYGCTTVPTTPCACNMQSRTTIFVSAKNTPAIRFPVIDDWYFGSAAQAGLQIGGASTIQYVFLEVHYNGALTTPDTTTGVDLQYTTTPLTLFVGIVSVMGVGTIPAQNSGYNLDSCVTLSITSSSGNIDFFGYQVHTHSLGRLVSVYTTYDDVNFEEIGRGNPQFPQAYLPYQKGSYYSIYPTAYTIYLRCLYDTTGQTSPTYTIGVAGQVGSEMCFGNLLYATDQLPPVNSFPRGDCGSKSANFPASSTQLFPNIPKLEQHALHGDQTGVVSIDSTHSMDLDLETF